MLDVGYVEGVRLGEGVRWRGGCKLGPFFIFFLFIKNYAATIKLIDEKVMSKEASYIAQQRSIKVSP